MGPVSFLIYIIDLSNTLENPLFLADDSTLCLSYSTPPPAKQTSAVSLLADLELIRCWSRMSIGIAGLINGTCPSILENLSLLMLLQKYHKTNLPIYFYWQPLKKVQSLELLGLTSGISMKMTLGARSQISAFSYGHWPTKHADFVVMTVLFTSPLSSVRQTHLSQL